MKDLHEFYSEKARNFLCTLRKRRFDIYIAVKSEPRSLECRRFSYRGDLELRLRDLRVLFPYGGDMNV